MNLPHLLIKIADNADDRSRGLSLLEIVLVLAMLSVLSTYSLPSYHTYIQRGYRLAAIAAIYRAAQFVEQALVERSVIAEDSLLILPIDLSRSPAAGKSIYQLEIQQEGGNNGGYKIVAHPSEDGPMKADVCGSYELDGLGRRSNQSNTELTSELIAACWQGRNK